MGKELGTAGLGDVTPVHAVTLTGFSMSKYPVTQAQYQPVMWLVITVTVEVRLTRWGRSY